MFLYTLDRLKTINERTIGLKESDETTTCFRLMLGSEQYLLINATRGVIYTALIGSFSNPHVIPRGQGV